METHMPPRRTPRPEGPRGPAGPRTPRRDGAGRPPTNLHSARPSKGPTKPARTRGRRADAPEGHERLQKILAHAGVDSRRSCEELITAGRVTVDGKVVKELGTRVDPRVAVIALDGEPVKLEKFVYFAVNKPKGYVSTNDDPANRMRVVDLLPEIPQRVYTVGRLDEMSTGLMLLTNDGELAHKLSHPKFGVEKVYRAVVAGTPTDETYAQLVEGVWLAEGKVRAKRVRPISKKGEATVLELVLAEGKNREVRRMLAKFGHKVMTLTRVAVGPVTMRGLNPGGCRALEAAEVEALRKVAAGIFVPTRTDRGDAEGRPIREVARRVPERHPSGDRPKPFEGGPRDVALPFADNLPGVRPRPPARPLDAEDRPNRPRPTTGPPARPRFDQDGPRPPRPSMGGRPERFGDGDDGPRPARPMTAGPGRPAPDHGPRPGRAEPGNQGRPTYFDNGVPRPEGPGRPDQDRPGRPPQGGPGRPSFGGDGPRPAQGGPDRPPFGRPTFGSDGPRPPRPMQGGPDRPAFGNDGPRPMQGGPDRPRFGRQDGPMERGGPGGDRRPTGNRDQGPRPARPPRDEPPKRRILGMDSSPTPARPPLPTPATRPTPTPPPPAAVDEPPTYKRPSPRKAPASATKRPKPRKLRGGPAEDATSAE